MLFLFLLINVVNFSSRVTTQLIVCALDAIFLKGNYGRSHFMDEEN